MSFPFLTMQLRGTLTGVADLDHELITESLTEMEYMPREALRTFGANGLVDFSLDIANMFDMKCQLASATMYLSNTNNSTDIAVAGKAPLLGDCDIGPFFQMFSVPDTSAFTIYGHYSDNPPRNVPRSVLTGEGEVALNVLGQDFEFASCSFEVDAATKQMHVEGKLQLPGIAEITMRGNVTTENAIIEGGFGIEFENPLTKSTFSFNVNNVLSWNMEESLATLNHDANLEYCPFGSNDLCVGFDVSVDIGTDGSFVVCLDVFSGQETDADVDQDNCLDMQALATKANDDECYLGRECQSGRCEGAFFPNKGTCQPRLADGSDCNENSDCRSKFVFAHSMLMKPFARPIITCMSVGNRCEGFLTSQTCQGTLETGSLCNENSDCDSGKCAAGFCSDGLAGDICDENNDCQTETCVLFYCQSRQLGDACEWNSDCDSGRCEGVFPPQCREKLDGGSFCTEHSDCLSDRCRFGFCTDQ